MVSSTVGLGDLWSSPDLDVDIVWASEHRLSRVVDWVSAATSQALVDDLEGNVLVVSVSDDQEAIRLIEAAAEAGTDGITVLTSTNALVREPLLAAARRNDVALAILVTERSATEIARRWNTHVVRAGDTRADDASDLHEQLVRALLANGGISGAMRLAIRQVGDFDAVVFTYYGEIVGQRHPSAGIVADAPGLYATAKQLLLERDWAEMTCSNGTTIVAAAVRVDRNSEAFLVFRGPRKPSPPDRLAFKQCKVAVLLELGRQLTFRQARRAEVEPFLVGVEDGSLSVADTRDRLQRLGFEAAEGYRVLCLSVSPDLNSDQICSLAEDALGTSGTPVVGSLDDHVYCIIEESSGGHATRLLAACNDRGWVAVHIGMSRVKADAAELRVAMRESLVAASHQSSFRSGVQHVEELGIHAVLAPLLISDAATSFLSELLGPLIERDAIENSRFLETLVVYFDEGCRPGATAKRLNVHRHTLAYRLDRIESLLGINPRDPSRLLTFALAVRLWKELDH